MNRRPLSTINHSSRRSQTKADQLSTAASRDRLTRERRSWNMSRIRGKHTAPELIVRSLLHRLGYRFRLHQKIEIPGGARLRRALIKGTARHFTSAEAQRKSRPVGMRAVPLPGNRKSQIANRKSADARAAASIPPSQLSTKNHQLRTPNSALRTLTVRPDIILPKYKTAIFVHGCFWHRHRGCKRCTTPTHRREWWVNKLEGNAARDNLHQRALRKLGGRVIQKRSTCSPPDERITSPTFITR